MSDESTGLHEASHYKFTRRVITPTFPVEGDYLKIETEEAIFGILFAYMFFWLMKQLRGVFAWYRESRDQSTIAPSGSGAKSLSSKATWIRSRSRCTKNSGC